MLIKSEHNLIRDQMIHNYYVFCFSRDYKVTSNYFWSFAAFHTSSLRAYQSEMYLRLFLQFSFHTREIYRITVKLQYLQFSNDNYPVYLSKLINLCLLYF